MEVTLVVGLLVSGHSFTSKDDSFVGLYDLSGRTGDLDSSTVEVSD